MANAGDVFRSCTIELDARRARRCWAEIAPGMSQPRDDFEALVALHIARTMAESVPKKLRVYSHEWLLDRNLPSQLPDKMRPRSQRVDPREVEAVGVSVRAMTEGSIELARAIEKAMSDAVAECYAEGETGVEHVRARMEAARLKVLRI